MFEKLKQFFYKINPFEFLFCMFKNRLSQFHTPVYDSMLNRMQEIHNGVVELKSELKYDKELLIKELEKKEAIIQAIMNMLPDMLWLKDTQGNYIYANKAIREKLLFDEDPIGKNDYEISTNAKKIFGANNHTFGEVCGNSDLVVLGNGSDSQRFMESGYVKGQMLHLEVHKGVIKVNGEVIGVVGSGRDMTEYREAYLHNGCNKCPKMEDIFSKYEFKNTDNGEGNGRKL
jgi:PAS domain-containing protein